METHAIAGLPDTRRIGLLRRMCRQFMKRLLAVVLLWVSLAPYTKGQADDQKILYDFCYADPWDTGDLVCELGITNADGYTPTSLVYRPSSTNWLTGGPYDARSTQPAPSPDGSRIAFVRGAWWPQEGHPTADVDLFLFRMADASLVQLTSGPANDASPAWSPDGGKIAFASDRDGPLDLYVMNADGSGITRLTSNVGFAGAPAWAPDGARIAFDCRPAAGANTDICAINSDGSGFVRLTTHPADDSGAAFAPTDGRIAFATRRFGATFELVIGAAGDQVQRVGTGTPGVQPAWSPDGTRLAYMDPDSVSYTGRCYFDGGANNADDFCVPVNDLFVVNVDGSGKAQFASGAHARWMAPRSAGSSPYLGAPIAVPGRIEAENYDKGGRGVGYADLTAGNSGGEYRPDDVDIERVTGSATDYNVGWMVAGEWLQYTIDVGAAGTYTVDAQVASYGGGGTFHLEVNGAKSGSIQVPDTGGWQQWQTVTATMTVGAGVQQLRVVLDTNGASGGVGNLDYLRLSSGAGPVPGPVGFTVQADSFAGGAQGCWPGPFDCGGGYYDETPGNWGDAQVRPGTDVDLWYDDGGIVIGGLDGLEWVTFAVNVPQTGNYAVTFRTASPSDRPAGSGVVNVGIHGVDGSWVGNQPVPTSGDPGEWHSYVSWNAPRTIYLPAGQQTLTLWASGGWYNVRNMTFTPVR